MAMPHLDANCERIIKTSNRIAHEYELEYVGTEHILLAILREGSGIGAEVLQSFGVEEESARLKMEELNRKAMEDTWVFGRLPGSPHYRNVIALAIDEATQLESRQIHSEHLLLALIREKASTAAEVLAHLGVDLERCRAEVLKRLGGR